MRRHLLSLVFIATLIFIAINFTGCASTTPKYPLEERTIEVMLDVNNPQPLADPRFNGSFYQDVGINYGGIGTGANRGFIKTGTNYLHFNGTTVSYSRYYFVVDDRLYEGMTPSKLTSIGTYGGPPVPSPPSVVELKLRGYYRFDRKGNLILIKETRNRDGHYYVDKNIWYRDKSKD